MARFPYKNNSIPHLPILFAIDPPKTAPTPPPSKKILTMLAQSNSNGVSSIIVP